MNTDKLKEYLEKEYGCKLLTVINLPNSIFAKCIETNKTGYLYRYFKYNISDFIEVKDEETLNMLKSMCETNDDNIY